MEIVRHWRNESHMLNPLANGFRPNYFHGSLILTERTYDPIENGIVPAPVESGITIYQATQDQVFTAAVLVKRQQTDAGKLASLPEELGELPGSPNDQVVHEVVKR